MMVTTTQQCKCNLHRKNHRLKDSQTAISWLCIFCTTEEREEEGQREKGRGEQEWGKKWRENKGSREEGERKEGRVE